MNLFKLQDCCDLITDGVHNTPPLTIKGIPLLDGANIEGLIIDDSNPQKYISKDTDAEISKRCKPIEKDVLISSRGSIGKVALVRAKQDFNIMGNIILLRTSHGLLRPKFLAYYLLYNRDHLENISRGVAQKGLYLKDVRSYEIPLPPLPVQQKIATILDTADALKQKDKALIAKYDELSQSLFLHMFGDPVTNPMEWNKSNIEFFSEVQGGLQVSRKRAIHPIEIKYLRVANVYRNKLDLSEIKTMKVTESERKRVLLKKNDLLIVEGHGNIKEIGRVGLWDDSIKPIIHQNHLIRVRVQANIINPIYLCHFLNSDGGRKSIITASNTTSGLNTISTRIVKETKCNMPPITLQNQFAERIQTIEQQKQQAQASLQKSEDLFNCLLQKAFKGELVC